MNVHALSIAASLITMAGVIFLFWVLWMMWQMRAKGAPFWPSSVKRLEKMVELAKIQAGDVVVDLGSGDGRLVIAAAERGAKRSVGYEIDPFWFNVAEEKKRRSSHAERIEFIKQSFWDVDFLGYDVVFLYQGKHVLKPLVQKLQKDLKPGSRVVSNSFKLPGWKHAVAERGVYLYIK